MGMLSFDKSSESHMAIISYENEHDWNSFQSVKVLVSGAVKYSINNVRIIVKHGTYNSDLCELNIMWEEAGILNYKEEKLFCVYSSEYVEMEYRKGVLIIHASRNMDIIIG